MWSVLDYSGVEATGDEKSERLAEPECGASGAAGDVAGVFLFAGGDGMTRAGMRPVARETRAYFAPVDRVSGTPAVFDPSQDAGFLLDAPTAPWIDLGWVENFDRSNTSVITEMASGPANAVTAQARNGLGARIDFEFRDWGKLQMALAGGAEHMNVLATDPSASRAGSGGIAVAAVAVLAGSSSRELVLGA